MGEIKKNSSVKDCEMKKVFVDETNQATIICPKCGLKKDVDVTKFKNTQKKLKANSYGQTAKD